MHRPAWCEGGRDSKPGALRPAYQVANANAAPIATEAIAETANHPNGVRTLDIFEALGLRRRTTSGKLKADHCP